MGKIAFHAVRRLFGKWHVLYYDAKLHYINGSHPFDTIEAAQTEAKRTGYPCKDEA